MSNHVTCPYCGYIYTDGDEAFMPGSLTLARSFDEECVECGKTFIVTRDVRPVYRTTEKGVPS